MGVQLTREDVVDAFRRRVDPGRALADEAERVARACHDIAHRFHRGGTLVVFGNGGPSTDAQHIAVEFVHPVIVGKRALPALSLTNDVATVTGVARQYGFDEVFAAQLRLLAHPHDIALGISSDGNCANVLRGLEVADQMGLLTVALVGGHGGDDGAGGDGGDGGAGGHGGHSDGGAGGDGGAIARSKAVAHRIVARTGDAQLTKEVHVTAYHILWELVHVFFEQPRVLGPGVVQ